MPWDCICLSGDDVLVPKLCPTSRDSFGDAFVWSNTKDTVYNMKRVFVGGVRILTEKRKQRLNKNSFSFSCLVYSQIKKISLRNSFIREIG